MVAFLEVRAEYIRNIEEGKIPSSFDGHKLLRNTFEIEIKYFQR